MSVSAGVRIGVFVLAAIAVASSAYGELIFSRPIPPGSENRKIERDKLMLPPNISAEDLQGEIASDKRIGEARKDIISMELLDDPKTHRKSVLTTYLGEDLKEKALERQWAALAVKKYAIAKVPENFVVEGPYASLDWSADIIMQKKLGTVTEKFKSKAGLIESHITIVEPETIPPHEFLRRAIHTECRVKQIDGIGTVVECRESSYPISREPDEIFLLWLVDEHHQLEVSALVVAPSLVGVAFGQKFPSSLPKDFKIDKTQWGRDEIDLWLTRMDKAVRDPAGAGHFDFTCCLNMILASVFVPMLAGYDITAVESKDQRQLFEELRDWWNARCALSQWDEKYRKLVVQNETPKDFEKSKRDRDLRVQKAATQPALDQAAVKDAAAQVSERYEEVMRRRVAEFGGHLEKRYGGGWVISFQSTTLKRRTTLFVGPPSITRTDDPRHPLEARFDHVTDDNVPKHHYEKFVYDGAYWDWVQAVPNKSTENPASRPQ